MRFGFVTCVELGLSCIETVLDLGGRFEMLMTLRDDLATGKSGRVHLDEVAETHDIPLTKIGNINEPDALRAIRAADLDWLFIIGWSQIAKEGVLAAARHGVLGMHPTLLPEGRGRASIPWAILKNLNQTGVTMFKLNQGVDTGPILAQTIIDMVPRESATTLYEKVNRAHIDLMRDAFPLLQTSAPVLTPQDHSRASEWPGRGPSDGEIKSSTMTIDEIDRLVRAVTHPYPGAFFRNARGMRVRVWRGSPSASPAGIVSGTVLEVPAIDGTFYADVFDFETADSPTDRRRMGP